MVDYLKDIAAKKRHLNEKIRTNTYLEVQQLTKPPAKSNKKLPIVLTEEEIKAYDEHKNRLQELREDRGEQRRDVHKWLSHYEKQKRSEKAEEFKSEISLREQYENRWREQEHLYEKEKTEREQRRIERSKELQARAQEFKDSINEREKAEE